MASLDWSQCAAVESIPGKVSGAWVLRGTRLRFDGLNREQVKAVIEFATRSLDRAPAYTP